MNFTISAYKQLLEALRLHHDVSIKHDVDQHPLRSLRIAEVEKAAGVKSTYYFRVRHLANHASTIKAIASLGHQIGYHYENMSTCRGNYEKAYEDFAQNLDRLRQLAPVNTACAHGSPMSKWDNQSLWNQYDIHSLGIAFEPMLDTDFSSTLYLTDTGRRWDGAGVSVRDKVSAKQAEWCDKGLTFHTTRQLISALQDSHNAIHRHALLVNTHPQRWLPFGLRWVVEAAMQHAKNAVKYLIVKFKR